MMVKHTLMKAKRSFGWLLSTIKSNGWTNLNLKLVLFEVYVRSLLQYGCVVWSPKFLLDGINNEHSVIKPLLV